MKVALTIWDGRISPVFDVSREAVLLSIEDGEVAARSCEKIETRTAGLKIDRLVELGIETLVCGAISEPLRRELTARGVKIFGFVSGEIDEVVQALVADALPAPALSMPGCHGRQNRFRGGRGQGRGCGRGQGQGRGRGQGQGSGRYRKGK